MELLNEDEFVETSKGEEPQSSQNCFWQQLQNYLVHKFQTHCLLLLASPGMLSFEATPFGLFKGDKENQRETGAGFGGHFETQPSLT